MSVESASALAWEARQAVLDDLERLEDRYREEGRLFEGAFVYSILRLYGRLPDYATPSTEDRG